MSEKNNILSLGDCNTLGTRAFEGNAYPERFARMIGASVSNRGFTMSTVREAEYIFRDYYNDSVGIVTLQFGLVDSWKTFIYSPYVLYYPDNLLRKLARKIVKKYKKICRQTGLNDRFGTKFVVPPEQYVLRLREIIAACRPDTQILLIETVPNQDESRNPAIREYNRLMKQIAGSDPRCSFVELYEHFSKNLDRLYADPTHINAEGHEFVAQELFKLYAGS